MKRRPIPKLVMAMVNLAVAGVMVLGCSVATDPVNYEDFVKTEGEGEFGIWVHSGLYNRTYFLHTPPNMGEVGSHPLLILLHGAGGTGEYFHRLLSADEVTDSGRIIAFRNRLIHGYTSISDAVVWGVIESNLPTLHREVGALLGEDED